MASPSYHLRVVFHDSDTHRPISGIRVVAAAHCRDGATVPLGLLDTDAAGYVSFDLLPLLSRSNIDSLWVAPLADLQQKTNVLATGVPVAAGGFGGSVPASRETGIAISSSIFVEIGLIGPLAPLGATPALPSIQNATIDDWRFSPGSFAVNAPLPLGLDNCEQLLPSTLPLSEFRFRQMILGAEELRSSFRRTQRARLARQSTSGKGLCSSTKLPGILSDILWVKSFIVYHSRHASR
jgi:hypothetical protein